MSANAGLQNPFAPGQKQPGGYVDGHRSSPQRRGRDQSNPPRDPYTFGLYAGREDASGHISGLHHPSHPGTHSAASRRDWSVPVPLAVAVVLMALVAGFRVTSVAINKPQLTTLEYRGT